MKIIKVPTDIKDQNQLIEINQQLRDRTAKLDWSGVMALANSHLEILLDGVPEDDEEILNLEEGLSDTLINNIFAYFAKRTPIKTPTQTIKTPEKKLLNPPQYYQIRTELEQLIFKDLLGPAGGETEEINEISVSDRYLVGILAPTNRHKTPENESNANLEEDPALQDELAANSNYQEDSINEPSTPSSVTMFPSSLGMTFTVDEQTTEILIIGEWGQYQREKSETLLKEDGTGKLVWKRYPRQGQIIEKLIDGKEFSWDLCPEENPQVTVTGKIRLDQRFGWMITVFLVNNQYEPSKLRDSAWLFQAKLTVKSTNLQRPDIFVKKTLPDHLSKLDPAIQLENQTMAMLYRHRREFAVGHGVSVQTQISEKDSDRAVSITTVAIPSYEVAKTTPPTAEEIPGLQDLILDMQVLASLSPQELITCLQTLPQSYEQWINTQVEKIKDPQEKLQPYQQVAKNAIAKCQKTLQRIQAGINTLAHNTQAFTAFQFMNRSMYLQRIHSLYAEQIRRGKNITLDSLKSPKNHSWFPFQLAFILINLPSLTELNHPERVENYENITENIADLLWFPTGGGKTEAYLGLTAYTIAIRRLQGMVSDRDGGKGVAVLMRYTLRLLTLQQFQRATTLICACETIRRENQQIWGEEPIRIGLWVGGNSTPNITELSSEIIKDLKTDNFSGKKGTPHQLNNCPWCGEKINPGRDITVETFTKGQCRTLIKCGNISCLFATGEGLPILVVDEEIYRRLPTVLIATVDKFAQLPWKGETQMLFGRVDGYCQRHGFRSSEIADSDRHNKLGKFPAAKTINHPQLRPPDLIIQDELHLISGPLGTMVGLYETAIDHLATWEVNGQKIRPKIVASTATIKQAKEQIYNLFHRHLEIFPPPCLDLEDNFFSRQRPPSDKNPGRLYLGICAPGRRLKATIIRVYLAVLSASQTLYEKYGENVDPWMTLVGYFNSLRELGGTRRLVDDDISNRLIKMDQRGLSKRNIYRIDELTSRKNSTEIPEILDSLEMPFTNITEDSKKAQKKTKPLDIILATNMISVGVDVKRLGMMVTCGQPKNTAEYIQATSRVGRSYPGLVITVYNWAKPRDLSHYERFAHYHATFYQNVEALSVTPFAPGAVYRGLSALLVSLIRLVGKDFNGNATAGEIDRNHPYIQTAIRAIVDRAKAIDGNDTAAKIEQELVAKLDQWLNQTKIPGGAVLKYTIEKDGKTKELLQKAGYQQWRDFTCLNSLRNVEPTIDLIFTNQPPDNDGDRKPQPYTKNHQD